MKPGVYTGLSFDEYLSIEAINKSSLQHIAKTPAHFFSAVLDPKARKKESDALRVGNAIHTLILEPDLYLERYVVIPPDAPRRPSSTQINAKKPSDETIKTIAFWEDFDAKNKNKIQLDIDEQTIAESVAGAFRKSVVAQELFEAGDAEVTLVWEDPIEGILCKGRLDWLNPETGMTDLKSTLDASVREFARSAMNYGYHFQAAWYHDGYKALTGLELPFIFGAFEKTEPFASRFFVASDKMLELGRQTYRPLLKKYAECLKTNTWEGYADEIVVLDPPAWAMKGNNGTEIQEF